MKRAIRGMFSSRTRFRLEFEEMPDRVVPSFTPESFSMPMEATAGVQTSDVPFFEFPFGSDYSGQNSMPPGVGGGWESDAGWGASDSSASSRAVATESTSIITNTPNLESGTISTSNLGFTTATVNNDGSFAFAYADSYSIWSYTFSSSLPFNFSIAGSTSLSQETASPESQLASLEVLDLSTGQVEQWDLSGGANIDQAYEAGNYVIIFNSVILWENLENDVGQNIENAQTSSTYQWSIDSTAAEANLLLGSNLPPFNTTQPINLGGVDADDILLTSRNGPVFARINGQTATLLNPEMGTATSYNLGHWTNEFQDGDNLVFDNQFLFGNKVEVLNPSGLQTYQNLPEFDSIKTVNLGSGSSDDLLLTNSVSVFGIPVNNPSVTVINPDQATSNTYNIGNWRNEFQDGNNLIFDDLLFTGHNISVINGSGLNSYQDLPTYDTVQTVNLGGADQHDLLLTDRVASFFGVPVNSPTVTLLNPDTQTVKSYNIGTWRQEFQEGNYLIFDNLRFSGNMITVLSPSGLTVYSNLPQFNNVDAIQVGDPADVDVVLTGSINFFGIPANSTQVTVLRLASNTKTTYTLPTWEFDARVGNDLDFYNLFGTLVYSIPL